MNKRILILNWILAETGLSGGIKSNRLIAEAMVRRGHKVNIYYVDLPMTAPPIWRIRTFIKYLVYRYLLLRNPEHHLQQSTANLVPVREKPIKSEVVTDADFIFATWWETAYWIRDWPLSKGRKAYFIRHHELHGSDVEMVKGTYRLPYKKFVIASWLKKLMAESYGDNSATLIPNGIDRKQFLYERRQKQPLPTVGFLYGVVKWKGAQTAFDAIKLAQLVLPELRIVCFGANLIERGFTLPQNFQYYFRPKQTYIPAIYKSVDCWLVPSTKEGFGMPGLEAAFCDCPLVSTKSGGPEDYLLEGVNGFLVDVGNARDMADKLIKVVDLSSADWEEMSRNSAKIASTFDWD